MLWLRGSSPFRRIGWRGVGSLFFPLFPLFFSMYRYKEKRQEKEGRQLSKSSSSLFYLTMRNATFTRPIVLIATVISRFFLSSCYHSLLPLQPSGQDNEDVTHTTQRDDDDEEKLQIQWARTQHFQSVSKRSPLFDIDPSTAGRRSITWLLIHQRPPAKKNIEIGGSPAFLFWYTIRKKKIQGGGQGNRELN